MSVHSSFRDAYIASCGSEELKDAVYVAEFEEGSKVQMDEKGRLFICCSSLTDARNDVISHIGFSVHKLGREEMQKEMHNALTQELK